MNGDQIMDSFNHVTFAEHHYTRRQNKMDKMAKIIVNEIPDPMCPKCNIEMYGVSAMTFGKDKKFKHYAQCPQCDYKTKAK
jgi:hypothetical protein